MKKTIISIGMALAPYHYQVAVFVVVSYHTVLRLREGSRGPSANDCMARDGGAQALQPACVGEKLAHDRQIASSTELSAAAGSSRREAGKIRWAATDSMALQRCRWAADTLAAQARASSRRKVAASSLQRPPFLSLPATIFISLHCLRLKWAAFGHQVDLDLDLLQRTCRVPNERGASHGRSLL